MDCEAVYLAQSVCCYKNFRIIKRLFAMVSPFGMLVQAEWQQFHF